MYNLPYFKEQDEIGLLQFMRQHDFIILCGTESDGTPVATQVPVLIREQEGRIILEGHIMRNTDHHKAFVHNEKVLALFVGPHAYISSSWYENPQQASTWNYMTVHAKGKISFGDQQHLLNILKETTDHYEGSTDNFANLSEEYIHKLIGAIVSFTIEVTSLEHVFKLSQNRSAKDHQSVIDHLSSSDEPGRMVAKEMINRKKQ
jgi:transcriptional regulator